MINGFMVCTMGSEWIKETQNSRVVVMGENGTSNLDYYGVLQEVIKVLYVGGNHVVLFKCDWWDVHSQSRGIVTDCFELISINPGKRLVNDPYVLASQVRQVFYVEDVTKSN
ncbi:Orotate phosphoribosyltransferase [Bienertia sinuspersici]